MGTRYSKLNTSDGHLNHRHESTPDLEITPDLKATPDLEATSVTEATERSSIPDLREYEHMLRWLSFRAFRRRRFHQIKSDWLTRFWTVSLFLIACLLLLAGWVSQLGVWLHSQVSYWTSGWGYVLGPPAHEAISRSLIIPYLILSVLSLLSMLHITTSDTYLTVNLFISKVGWIAALVILAVEVILIYPLCWASLFPSKLKDFCQVEHDVLWKAAALSFAGLQAFFGVVFGTFLALTSLTRIAYYASSPLCCILGPWYRVAEFRLVTSMGQLKSMMRYTRPVVPDIRVIKMIEQTLKRRKMGVRLVGMEMSNSTGAEDILEKVYREEDRSTETIKCIARMSNNNFALISFQLRSFYRTFEAWWWWFCDRGVQFDAMYLGQVDEIGRPDGVGVWIDLRSDGETLFGCWDFGN